MGEKRIVRFEVEKRHVNKGELYIVDAFWICMWPNQNTSALPFDVILRVLPGEEVAAQDARDESISSLRLTLFETVGALVDEVRRASEHLKSIAASERVRAKAEVMRGKIEAAHCWVVGMRDVPHDADFDALLKELP